MSTTEKLSVGDKVQVSSNGIVVGVGTVSSLKDPVIVVRLEGKHKFSADGEYRFLPHEVKRHR